MRMNAFHYTHLYHQQILKLFCVEKTVSVSLWLSVWLFTQIGDIAIFIYAVAWKIFM